MILPLLERFRPLLRLQVRRLDLDARLRRRFDSSDLIQEAIARAVARAVLIAFNAAGAFLARASMILDTVGSEATRP